MVTRALRTRFGVALAFTLLLVRSTDASAQGTVRGSLTLLERAGGASRDVGSALVYLEAASPSASPGYVAPQGLVARPGSEALATASIDMKHREFEPHVQFVRVGGTVGFPNSDPFSHNVFSNSALGAFDLGLYRSGVTRRFTFPSAGVYAIYCNIHARMVSFVVAVTTPWVATARNDGQFSIPGVPAGRYKLHAWHERTPEVVREIVVTATGLSDVALTLDARGYVAKPHLNKFGAPYAITRADRY